MTKTSAINRIHDLLDDNSFVEVGAYITARSTDYNMQSQETPADGVVTGYGTIISDTEIEKEIESEDNSETDEEDSIS